MAIKLTHFGWGIARIGPIVLTIRRLQLMRRSIAYGVLDSLFPCDNGALVIRFLVATPQKQIPIIWPSSVSQAGE